MDDIEEVQNSSKKWWQESSNNGWHYTGTKFIQNLMPRIIQIWIIFWWYKFIQKVMTRIIQQWMILKWYKIHPKSNDKNHPNMDDYRWHESLYRERHTIIIQKWMILNGEYIVIQKWMNSYGQFSSIFVVGLYLSYYTNKSLLAIIYHVPSCLINILLYFLMQETKDTTLKDQTMQAEFLNICKDLIRPFVYPVDCPKPFFRDIISSHQHYDEFPASMCCYGDSYSSKQGCRCRCGIERQVKSVCSRERIIHLIVNHNSYCCYDNF